MQASHLVSFLREVFGTLLLFMSCLVCCIILVYIGILFEYYFYLEQGVVLIGAVHRNSFSHNSEPAVGVTEGPL